MSQDDIQRWKMKMLLDESYQWPAEYLFKFIVLQTQVDEVIALLGEMQIEQRPSSNGKYVSVNAKKVFHSSEEILQVYQKIKVVKGVIAL